jgi:hypothetical protein
MEKKREGDREAAGEVFFYHLIPYITVFFVLGMGKGSC